MVSFNSIEEAQHERLDLVDRITAIEVQLAAREASTASREEFLEWRARALRARHMLSTKLRRTKAWISEQRDKEAKERVSRRGGEDGLLSQLYSLVKDLASDGVELDPDEQALLDDIDSYLSSTRKESNEVNQ